MTDLLKKDWKTHLTPKLLDRYVAREFLFGYVVSVAAVLTLRLLGDLFVNLDEFTEDEKTGAVGNIISFYGPQLLVYFRDFSGVMVLVAAVFSLMRMTRQNELVAVLASGVSLKRLIAPVVLLGFLLNLLMVVDQEMLLPRLADRLTRKPDEVGEMQRYVPVYFLPDRDGALLCARRYDHIERSMEDMLVIFRDKGQMQSLLRAPKAYWNDALEHWDLQDGQSFHTDQGGGRSGGWRRQDVYESDLSADYLWLQRNASFKSLISSRELNATLKRALKPADRAETISEKYFRFTDPIINMVMLLMGLPLLVSREKRSTKTAIAVALLGAGGCYVATFACKFLAGSGAPILSDPLLAAWAPIIIFLPVSVLALDELKT